MEKLFKMKKLLPKNWKPIFIENSKIPVWLSKISPLNIGAITLFPFVISRGKMDETTKRHETIHFQQALETLVVLFYVFYLFNWLWGLIKYRKDWKDQKNTRGGLYASAANKAYHRLKAEQEAYNNETDVDYLQDRKRWRWMWKYKV
tara:strand:- start:6492 stop:6932 length:441 start_codon:yes stop_codon:yes gene_type:complete